MRTLIADAVVVTNDDSGTVLLDGAVFVEGERIVEVGPSDALRARHTNPDRVIDGCGKLVMPGFVCSHTHVGYALFRSAILSSCAAASRRSCRSRKMPTCFRILSSG
jgi:cytosine/adenosine deaminase-related metal-dependent hydrolase